MKLLFSLLFILTSFVGVSQDPLNLKCNEEVFVEYILDDWEPLVYEENMGYTFILLADRDNPNFEIVMAINSYSEYIGYYYYTNYGGYFYVMKWLKENAEPAVDGYLYKDTYWISIDLSEQDSNLYMISFICLK